MVSSCDYFKAPREPKAIARVGKSYLYESDILNLVPKGTSEQDSIAIVKSFIGRWATQKLLFEAAEKNIGKDQLDEFNVLIEQYKVDLYTKAYLENLVIRQVDTLVKDDQIVDYYNKNKQYFKNSSELVKLRYINLVKENPKFAKIKSKFSSFTKKDKKELEQMAVQFINLENKQKYVSSGMNFQYPDSTTIWLVKINNVLPKDSATPLEFLKPTIKQIIINNRKLELINTLEKEITNDAIKDNKYEIYK